MKNVSVAIGLVAVVLAALAIGAGIGDETRAGKKPFAKMAKATYINAITNSAGEGTGDTRSITVACDQGDKVLSGGFDELGANSSLRTNGPSDGDLDPPHDRWIVTWINSSGMTDLVDAFVLCSDFPPTHQP